MITKCLLLLVCMSVIFGDYKDTEKDKGIVLKLYYETQCLFSKAFMTSDPYLQTVYSLSSLIDLRLIPYGEATTREKNGILQFTCQHGSLECYGNKLHACAIKLLNNATKSAIFNSCMMAVDNGPGSNDAAADECSTYLDIDAEPIKQCAKGILGSQLLKHYGEETKKAHGVYYVPYISLNGVENDGMNLSTDVCEALSRLGDMNATLISRCRKLV